MEPCSKRLDVGHRGSETAYRSTAARRTLPCRPPMTSEHSLTSFTWPGHRTAGKSSERRCDPCDRARGAHMGAPIRRAGFPAGHGVHRSILTSSLLTSDATSVIVSVEPLPVRMVTLSPQMLLRAYAIGVFPMAESREDPEIYWIDPELRGVLPLDTFHMPRRLKKTVRQQPFEVRCDTDFEGVIN